MSIDVVFTTPHQDRVIEFMDKAGQNLPSIPTLPTREVALLRAKLILEEALETISALGFTPRQLGDTDLIDVDNTDFIPDKDIDLVGIVDGCCDVSVVTIGTLAAIGVGDGPLLLEVDRNNLAKFGPGHSRRADGKLIKAPGHTPPDIIGRLRAQGWEG